MQPIKRDITKAHLEAVHDEKAFRNSLTGDTQPSNEMQQKSRIAELVVKDYFDSCGFETAWPENRKGPIDLLVNGYYGIDVKDTPNPHSRCVIYPYTKAPKLLALKAENKAIIATRSHDYPKQIWLMGVISLHKFRAHMHIYGRDDQADADAPHLYPGTHYLPFDQLSSLEVLTVWLRAQRTIITHSNGL